MSVVSHYFEYALTQLGSNIFFHLSLKDALGLARVSLACREALQISLPLIVTRKSATDSDFFEKFYDLTLLRLQLTRSDLVEAARVLSSYDLFHGSSEKELLRNLLSMTFVQLFMLLFSKRGPENQFVFTQIEKVGSSVLQCKKSTPSDLIETHLFLAENFSGTKHLEDREKIRMACCDTKHGEVLQFLIDRQVDERDFFMKDEEGFVVKPELNFADALKKHKALALMHLYLGADINYYRGGETALHGAAREGNLQIVQFLLDHGASRELKNRVGLTAAEVAIARGHRHIYDCLTQPAATPYISISRMTALNEKKVKKEKESVNVDDSSEDTVVWDDMDTCILF